MSTTTALQTTGTRPAQLSTFADWLRAVTDPVIAEVQPEAADDIDGDDLLRRLREAGL